MNETKFGFWKNLFELWTNQEDLSESYSCRNEENISQAYYAESAYVICPAPLVIYGGLQPDWHTLLLHIL